MTPFDNFYDEPWSLQRSTICEAIQKIAYPDYYDVMSMFGVLNINEDIHHKRFFCISERYINSIFGA